MTDRLGQQFGQYRLGRFLGQGSFGEVYLGEHIHHNNTLAAVKVLQARLTAEDLKEFINEASTTFRLQHPHIVRLLDFGIGPANTPFLAMAYAPNGTLRQRHPKGTHLSLDSIIAYVRPIAAALQHAHDERLIHRDVKPENILLGPNNEVWLSDFGIVAVAHSTRSLDTERPGGTVPYMAPEQLRGKPRPASDQYALGIIVYEWLCGERPFGGTATEIAMQHFLEPPPSLREKVPAVSPDVEQVVLTALAKDPAARFASVQAFATALQAAAGVQPMDLRSARTSGVSVAGAVPPAAASAVGGASPPGQTNEQRVPAVPPPAVVGNLDAPARVPLPGKQVPTTVPSIETVASSPAPLWAEGPSPATHLPSDGRAASQASLPVAQQKKPLSSIPITPGSLPARVRLPGGRAIVLALLVLVVGSGGIWAALYLTHQPPPATLTLAPSAYDQFVMKNGIQFGFDAQHSRFNPYESELSPATVSTLVQAWNATTGNAIGSSPAVANGVVYVGSGDHKLYAFKADGCGQPTCSFLWTASAGGAIESSPAVANGVVYVGSFDDKLYAFKADGCGQSTCQPLWTASTGDVIYSSPAVANGVVYVGSYDHKLYAFRRR